MAQAITTRYVADDGSGPNTDQHIVVHSFSKSIRVEWDDRLSAERNHDAAAMQLIREMNWLPGANNAGIHSWVKGTLPPEVRESFVYVSVPFGNTYGVLDFSQEG